MHPAPADFAFRRQALAISFGDIACFAECLGDLFLVLGRIGCPIMHPGSGIDSDDSRLANANVTQLPGNAAGLFDHRDKSVALFLRTHR
jgi:hypothetical protein